MAARTLPRLPPLGAASLYYLCIFGALGALLPFLPLVLTDRGLDARQVGLVLTVMPVTVVVLPPLWAMIADSWRIRTPIMRLASIGTGVSLLLLLPVASLGATLAAISVFCLFRAPLVPLADASTRSLLGAGSRDYGRIRIWGSIGFAAVAATTSALGAGALGLLVTACLLYLASGVVAFALPAPGAVRVTGVLTTLGHLLKRPGVVLFLVATLAYYSGHACYDAFVSLHWKALGHDVGFVGAAWATGVIAEIILLWFTPRLLSRWRAEQILPWCAAVATVRWLLLSRLTDPLAILAVQPLHAMTFGLWYVCVVDFVQNRAPESSRSAVQSIAMATIAGGRVVGYLLGGHVFEDHAGMTLFTGAAGAALLACLTYAGIRLVVNESTQLTTD